MPLCTCLQCGKQQEVAPSRAKIYKFCSYKCRGDWRAVHWTGSNNPRWQGGERRKACKHCGVEFTLTPTRPITSFRKQKFCSKACADIGQVRHSGEAHPLWKPVTRKKNRRGDKQRTWARLVISRDHATCQRCGATGVELHAHHIKAYQDYPESRWDVANGLTLCAKCHWAEHAAANENGVNSGNILPGNAGDNPEPSQHGNVLEGVTASGRAFRRWEGHCEFCGAFLSKRLSDRKKHNFCSKVCAGKFKAATRTYRPQRNPPTMAVIATKSAPRESDDIAWTAA